MSAQNRTNHYRLAEEIIDQVVANGKVMQALEEEGRLDPEEARNYLEASTLGVAMAQVHATLATVPASVSP